MRSRHHVASILADSGKATLRQIQKFLRHRRVQTTETYLHEVTRDQREVAEILEAGRKNPVPLSVPLLGNDDFGTRSVQGRRGKP